MIEAIPASNDVNLPDADSPCQFELLLRSCVVEGEERLADADSWRITGNPQVIVRRSD